MVAIATSVDRYPKLRHNTACDTREWGAGGGWFNLHLFQWPPICSGYFKVMEIIQFSAQKQATLRPTLTCFVEVHSRGSGVNLSTAMKGSEPVLTLERGYRGQWETITILYFGRGTEQINRNEWYASIRPIDGRREQVCVSGGFRSHGLKCAPTDVAKQQQGEGSRVACQTSTGTPRQRGKQLPPAFNRYAISLCDS